ncbi:lysophospholipase [Solibacillus sp. MA9]|uniref:Lysophospholipase n=1 Tax=Solibacillus palustris TaxID=2908203 RepID=A0ABS9UCR0_9BACL|nr:alpha/beta hydrolase [Solibacillus sp. MA9]MCH7322127.1 lysophospholipase [Solibacillus sp. MA9]
MEKNTFYLTMSDGYDIFVRTLKPQHPNKHIHILHGMAEHSERYEQFAEVLCAQGYYVTTHDHRGHGYTAANNGILGYFDLENGFERVVEDVREILEHLKLQDLGKPILFGHSMGSFIARRFTQKYSMQIERLILSGTGSSSLMHKAGHVLASQLVHLKGPAEPSKLMNQLSFGSFNAQVPNPKTEFDWLTSDQTVVQKYINDPFCGFVSTNQFYADLTGAMATLDNHTGNVSIRSDLKILLVSGTHDPVGEKQAKGVLKVGKQLVDAGVEHVKVQLFEGMRHEILNEIGKEKVYESIIRWLEHE